MINEYTFLNTKPSIFEILEEIHISGLEQDQNEIRPNETGPEEQAVQGEEKSNLHEPGAKDDIGKSMLGLVLGGFKEGLRQVGRVGTFGAQKYTPYGWMTVPYAKERYTDALYRHLFADGDIDDDSGLPHMAHVAWNALAILHFMEQEKKSCD